MANFDLLFKEKSNIIHSENNIFLTKTDSSFSEELKHKITKEVYCLDFKKVSLSKDKYREYKLDFNLTPYYKSSDYNKLVIELNKIKRYSLRNSKNSIVLTNNSCAEFFIKPTKNNIFTEVSDFQENDEMIIFIGNIINRGPGFYSLQKDYYYPIRVITKKSKKIKFNYCEIYSF